VRVPSDVVTLLIVSH